MAEKLGESFDTLAMVATKKKDTIKSLIKNISKLTSNNSELTATIKNLTNKLERALRKNRQSDNTDASNINGGNGHPGTPLMRIVLLVAISRGKATTAATVTGENATPITTRKKRDRTKWAAAR